MGYLLSVSFKPRLAEIEFFERMDGLVFPCVIKVQVSPPYQGKGGPRPLEEICDERMIENGMCARGERATGNPATTHNRIRTAICAAARRLEARSHECERRFLAPLQQAFRLPAIDERAKSQGARGKEKRNTHT